MFKSNCFLLGAKSIERGKEGKELDLCIVRLLVQDKDGGLIKAEFFYGSANNTKGINALVSKNNGMPVPVVCDFAFAENFNSSAVRIELLNFVSAS